MILIYGIRWREIFKFNIFSYFCPVFVLEFLKWLECEVEYVNKSAFLHLDYTGLCDKV